MRGALLSIVKKIQAVSPKPLGPVRALLDAGADVNYRGKIGECALGIAVSAADIDTMTLISRQKTRRPDSQCCFFFGGCHQGPRCPGAGLQASH